MPLLQNVTFDFAWQFTAAKNYIVDFQLVGFSNQLNAIL